MQVQSLFIHIECSLIFILLKVLHNKLYLYAIEWNDSVAQWICIADPLCSTALEYYNRFCRSMFAGKKCTLRCKNSISILRRQVSHFLNFKTVITLYLKSINWCVTTYDDDRLDIIGKSGQIEYMRVRRLGGLWLSFHFGQHGSVVFPQDAVVNDNNDGRHHHIITSFWNTGGGGRARGGGAQRHQQQQRRDRRPRPDRARARQRPPPRPSAPFNENTAPSSTSSGGTRHGRHRNQRGRNQTSINTDDPFV